MCHDEDRFRAEGLSAIPVRRSRWTQSDGHATKITCTGDAASSSSVVLLLHDAIGLRPFYEDVSAHLAQSGHFVVAPDYFSRLSPLADREPATRRRRRQAEMDEPRTILDICEIIDSMSHITQSEVLAEHVGIIGFCLGGMFALSVAAQRPAIRSCVTYYGFVHGQPGRSRVCLPPATDVASDIKASLLLFWGSDDADAYAPAAIDLFVRRASKGDAASADVRVYPGATHGFLRDIDGDLQDPNRLAATQSWDQTLQFLSGTLPAAQGLP